MGGASRSDVTRSLGACERLQPVSTYRCLQYRASYHRHRGRRVHLKARCRVEKCGHACDRRSERLTDPYLRGTAWPLIQLLDHDFGFGRDLYLAALEERQPGRSPGTRHYAVTDGERLAAGNRLTVARYVLHLYRCTENSERRLLREGLRVCDLWLTAWNERETKDGQ